MVFLQGERRYDSFDTALKYETVDLHLVCSDYVATECKLQLPQNIHGCNFNRNLHKLVYCAYIYNVCLYHAYLVFCFVHRSRNYSVSADIVIPNIPAILVGVMLTMS